MSMELRPPGLSYVTQAAEGLERRRWTVAEIEAMVAAGIIDEDERFELIDGDAVPMSPKGLRHEVIKASLNKWWMQRMPSGFNLIPETTFRLDTTSFIEPDFVFFSNTTKLADLKPANTLLCVEVADTSLRYDTGRKATLYATHGVCELWAINAETPANPHLQQTIKRRVSGAEADRTRRNPGTRLRSRNRSKIGRVAVVVNRPSGKKGSVRNSLGWGTHVRN